MVPLDKEFFNKGGLKHRFDCVYTISFGAKSQEKAMFGTFATIIKHRRRAARYTSIPLRRNVSALYSLCGLRRLIWVDTLRRDHNVGFSREVTHIIVC